MLAEGEEALDREQSWVYRRSATARISYLAQDRPDIQYASKEACRNMAHPCVCECHLVRAIARYLHGRPRLTWWFQNQPQPDGLVVMTDSDWGGQVTGRST